MIINPKYIPVINQQSTINHICIQIGTYHLIANEEKIIIIVYTKFWARESMVELGFSLSKTYPLYTI